MKGFKDRIRQNPHTRWVLIVSNALLQGILHASKTERYYKLLSTFMLSSICLWILSIMRFGISVQIVLVSLLVGHLISWLLNGNICTLLIHRLLLMKLNKRGLFEYLCSLRIRVGSEKSVVYCAAFGSLTRGDIKDSSDLDVSVVRYPGFMNGVKSLLFVFKEKKIAEFQGIPLEIYIDETPSLSKKRFGAEENPVVLYDPYCIIDKYYKEKQTIEEARDNMLKKGGLS